MEVTNAYQAGFFDGEGTINISGDNLWLSVGVSNTNTEILEAYKAKFGGKVSLNSPSNPSHKDYWDWAGYSKEASNLLGQLEPYLVVKKVQAGIAIEFANRFHIGKGHNFSRPQEEILKEKFTYKLRLEASRNVWAPLQMSKEPWWLSYLGGFFDAEGSISIDDRSINVTIGNNCPIVLEELQKVFGGGLYNKGFNIWGIHSSNSISFLEAIKLYSIIKREEIGLVLEYMKKFPMKGRGYIPSQEAKMNLFSCRLKLMRLHKGAT